MTTIKIKNVDIETVAGVGKKTGYQKAEVLYDAGQYTNQVKKLMSFVNPDVFKTISTATKGDLFEITSIKDDKGYVQWTSIKPANGEDGGTGSVGAPAARSATGSSSPVIKSTYETPEERAVKQRLIVRQSSLAQAIEYQKQLGEVNTLEGILVNAERLADWVYEKPSLFDQPNDLDTDIPY